ncbi:MAG: glycosyltransferase family 2 protein [Desulfobacterales bacterium]|uniref:Glycosyltransferase family 2 protein n=1 Tax=Candidatus Desulfatibia vada TaxID=2841696 RepID=A0A8J6P8L9_9BACT|nr:glycosyltransferase family 2 protein [Candidatus Desulfatibia vada]
MMDSSTSFNISIVVPVHNGGLNFRRCLSSLKDLEPNSLEIIVVADGCADDSSDVASNAGIQVINLPEPGGPARARNMGAMQAKGKFLFFVDADVTVPSDAVAQIGLAFEKEHELAAVIGSYDDSPDKTNFLSQYKNLLHHYIHQMGREEASTFWGACGAIRRDVFLEIGGFDESYIKPSIEDIELGCRLIQSGYKIRLLKSLQVKHLKDWRVTSLLKSDVLNRAIPWTELILRNRMFTNDLNIGFTSRISILLVYGLLIASLFMISWPGALLIASMAGLLLVLINLPVYRFFKRKRGFFFTLKIIPWHWFYYCYCGIGFTLGAICYKWRRMKLFSSDRVASSQK